MAEKVEIKLDALPDLDDLLQCPVCYEIPSGQIFQCNEGHHVCGRCKIRLDVCPVCRALFFGTRNYAMEELIANVRKLQAFKLGGKITTASVGPESNSSADSPVVATDNSTDDNENNAERTTPATIRVPNACKGLFRCLCCKNGNTERLPAARLLNHLRYFHSPELIEGRSENGEYIQAWQFSTEAGRFATAVRVTDMGIFFLVTEINDYKLYSWLSMAATDNVASQFFYTITISGNDREAIFSDCVWSVRSCEGSRKKRGHCLTVDGSDAWALTHQSTINAKLQLRYAPNDALINSSQRRTVLRIASRGDARYNSLTPNAFDSEPYIQDSESDINQTTGRNNATVASSENAAPSISNETERANVRMSRSARRRMRNRLRAALNAAQSPPERNQNVPAQPAQRANAQSITTSQTPLISRETHTVGYLTISNPSAQSSAPDPHVNGQSVVVAQRQTRAPSNYSNSTQSFQVGLLTVIPALPVSPSLNSVSVQNITRRTEGGIQTSHIPNITHDHRSTGSVVVQHSPIINSTSRNSRSASANLRSALTRTANRQPTYTNSIQPNISPNSPAQSSTPIELNGWQSTLDTHNHYDEVQNNSVQQLEHRSPVPSTSQMLDIQAQIENRLRANKKRRQRK